MRWMVIVALLAAGCTRRPLEEEIPTTARLRVVIDWSDSNIPVTRDDPTGGEHVHRVSLRFYPAEGAVFERYLEGNIFEGEVEVPPGSYDVVVMNESVMDASYWAGAVTFADVDDFERFSAFVEPMPPGRVALHHPFYVAARGEKINVEPLRLASWSVRGLEVTPGMAATRAEAGATIEAKMRRLTYNVRVTAHVRNLVSAQSFHTALRGLADRVMIASGETHHSPSTHVFQLNDRRLEPGGKHGTVSKSFLSMGRLPEHAERGGEIYTVDKDIVLRSGRLHTAAGPLSFDVTDQVLGGAGPDIEIVIGSELDPIELPWIEGGVSVEPWVDETIDLR